MRPTCLNCARKHLAKALINMNEARLGYPVLVWLAIGHMSEAEDELLARYPEDSIKIRDHRKNYEEDHDYIVPILEMIDDLTTLYGRQMQERDGANILPEVLEKDSFGTKK